jgi:hypothetical protein
MKPLANLENDGEKYQHFQGRPMSRFENLLNFCCDVCFHLVNRSQEKLLEIQREKNLTI